MRDEQDLFLNMEVVCKTLDAIPFSRNFKKGERLVNSHHIISCDVTKKTFPEIRIHAVCLQISAIAASPHTVTGILKRNLNTLSMEKMSCTCKAGASEKCKHIAGVLIYCTRLYINIYVLKFHLANLHFFFLKMIRWVVNCKHKVQEF